MSGDLSHRGSGVDAHAGVLTSTSRVDLNAAAGSADTWGAWADVDDSASAPSRAQAGMLVTVDPRTSNPTGAVQLGVSDGSTTVPIWEWAHLTPTYRFSPVLHVPLRVPPGATLRSRVRGDPIGVAVHWVPAGGAAPDLASRSETVGVTASGTPVAGTSVDPGGTADTKGAWTELTASTTFRWSWVTVAHMLDSSPARDYGQRWAVDLGVGAAGSEVVVVPDMPLRGASSQLAGGQPEFHGPLQVDIPSGSRVALRAQCSSATSPRRLIDFTAVVGFGP